MEELAYMWAAWTKL
nr:unnamed protein product [Callosobruchus chinensis]